MDLYQTLKLEKTATTEEIKKAYKDLAKKLHPDINKDDSGLFLNIKKAYEILSDDERKKKYDTFGDQSERSSESEQIRNHIINMVNNFINSHLIFNEADFIKETKKAIDKTIGRIEDGIIKTKSQIKPLEKYFDGIVSEEKYNKIVSGIIAQKIESLHQQINISRNEIEIVKKVYNIIKNMKYSGPSREEESFLGSPAFSSSHFSGGPGSDGFPWEL